MLHLKEDEIKSVQITNPIKLGEDIDDKTFVLDVNVLLNDNTIVNLEMQMQNERNWEERSLSYLCRSFDQLYQGQDYIEAKPAIHIGFLNFTPYPDAPEFYATYKLLNVKNKRLYSDKFVLSVVDLTHIELATEEDKNNQLDYWAKLFTATSWEELKMIAEKNPSMTEATQTLYELNADIITQEKCRARREYFRRQNTMNRDMALAQEAKEKAEKELAEIEVMLDQKEKELGKANEELGKANEELGKANEELGKANEELEKANEEIARLRARLRELEG